MGFTSDWMRKWRDIFKPISKRGNAQPRTTKANENYFRYSSENCSTNFDWKQNSVVSKVGELILFNDRSKFILNNYQLYISNSKINQRPLQHALIYAEERLEIKR